MSAELSIAIKIGAVVGGSVAAIRSVLSGTKDLGANIVNVQRQYDVLGRAIRQAAQTGSTHLAYLKRQQEALGRSLSNMHQHSARQTNLTARLESGRAAREQMKSEVMGAVAGIGTVLVPIKAAMDFESSMADIRKVVDFDTPQQFKEMEQQLLNMTHRIPMAATELTKIAASGGQLGIARQDIAGFTETIAKMSVAFDMSAEDAGDSMAKLANVYKIPIAKIGELGDAINHLSNNSPAKASDIVNTLGRVGGVAKQFGLTELQTASLANAFVSLGKTPEIAGTAINGMLTKLATAEKGGSKFQAALKSMGMSAKDLKHNIAKNGEQALMDFLKAINKLPKDKQMSVLVDLFGVEYADDVAVLSGSIDTYQKSIDALQTQGADGKAAFTGSMDKEFAARSATTAANWQTFKNQISHLFISIGSVVLPAINELLNSIKPLIDQFIQFIQTHPALIKNMFLALAAFASFKAGGLAVRFMLSGLGSLFLQTGSVIFGFFGLWERGATALRLFQMGRTISALRMFGLTARQARIWVTGFSRIGGLVSGSVRLIGTAFGWVMNVGRMLIGFLPMVVQAFMALGRFLLMNPIGIALSLMATAAYLLYVHWDKVVNAGKVLWQGLCMFFSGLWSNITAFFNSGIGNIVTTILNFSPLGLFYQAFASVMSWFGITLPTQFTAFGSMIIDGLVNGIKTKIASVMNVIHNMATSVKSAFTSVMQIHSPSRVFRSYGGFITDGLAIGVNKGANKPIGRVGELAGNLKNHFADRMSGFHGHLSSRLSANADTLSQIRTEHQATQAVGANGVITIHFNPTINVPNGNQQEVQTALQMGLREFEMLFQRMMADKERRAY